MRAVVVALVASVSLAFAWRGPAVAPQQLPTWGLYDRYCLACHGAAGDGNGPAAPFSTVRPRDFTRGAYRWRSTPIGEPPTDDDLRTTIRFGAPGTSMPGFDQILSDTDVDGLVALVKGFSPTTFATPARSVAVPGPLPAARDPGRGVTLWTEQGCATCHGTHGRGDGPSVGTSGIAAPYDLTRAPVRRPRSPASSVRDAIALSIATGLEGTGMPGYKPALSDADLAALADHVLRLGAHATWPEPSTLTDDAIAADRAAHLEVGTWPGTDPAEAAIFGAPLSPQGPPPASLAPAQASLSERQCARCHAKQAREWSTSVHARAATWGLGARELDHAVAEGTACNRCHTPLAEQQAPGALRAEGVTCAGCHVRGWTRHGPPRIAPTLLTSPSYPRTELAIYERSDLCLACHQLPPRTAVNGKPLLNTYKEWLESPYMARGIQCQHCHMPNREHTWLGIHDRDTVRQGIRLEASANRTDGVVSVAATLTNIGAGHNLPTTSTPALTLRIELLDEHDTPIAGARAETTIGRDVVYTDAWHERQDTRIRPGQSLSLARGWTAGRTTAAATARVTLEVAPDAYYERLYAERLATTLPPATRVAYEAALARAKRSHYVVEELRVAVRAAAR